MCLSPLKKSLFCATWKLYVTAMSMILDGFGTILIILGMKKWPTVRRSCTQLPYSIHIYNEYTVMQYTHTYNSYIQVFFKNTTGNLIFFLQKPHSLQFKSPNVSTQNATNGPRPSPGTFGAGSTTEQLRCLAGGLWLLLLSEVRRTCGGKHTGSLETQGNWF